MRPAAGAGQDHFTAAYPLEKPPLWVSRGEKMAARRQFYGGDQRYLNFFRSNLLSIRNDEQGSGAITRRIRNVNERPWPSNLGRRTQSRDDSYDCLS
jgi:hypothetical protein